MRYSSPSNYKKEWKPVHSKKETSCLSAQIRCFQWRDSYPNPKRPSPTNQKQPREEAGVDLQREEVIGEEVECEVEGVAALVAEEEALVLQEVGQEDEEVQEDQQAVEEEVIAVEEEEDNTKQLHSLHLLFSMCRSIRCHEIDSIYESFPFMQHDTKCSNRFFGIVGCI